MKRKLNGEILDSFSSDQKKRHDAYIHHFSYTRGPKCNEASKNA